jgi:hypothetical protein
LYYKTTIKHHHFEEFIRIELLSDVFRIIVSGFFFFWTYAFLVLPYIFLATFDQVSEALPLELLHFHKRIFAVVAGSDGDHLGIGY